MSVRIASIATALALSLGAVATPALAEVQTFNAWGHEFTVPGSPLDTGLRSAPGAYDTLTTGSVAPRAAGSAYRYSGPHAGGPANDLQRR